MRTHVPLVSVAVITGLTLLACGSGPTESLVRGKSRYSPPGHQVGLLHGSFHVPPDRSLHAVSVSTSAPSAGDAAAQVRADIDALMVAVTDEAACSVRVQNYVPPTTSSWDAWSASAELVLDIDLVGASDPMARMDRIDTCRALVLALATEGMVDVKNTDREHYVNLGAGALYIDDAEQHLPALLARRSKELSAVADVPGAAPQVHPEDYRCVPTGHVLIGHRNLEGVALDLELQCRVDDAVPAPQPEG